MKPLPKIATVALAALAELASGWAAAAFEAKDFPYPEMRVIRTGLGFDELASRVDQAVTAEGLALVTQASASGGAERRGIKIPGNMVLGVFRNDFAVRMLEASVPAGIEAPLRLYLTDASDGTATLRYRVPSAVFAPCGSDKLSAMAAELDALFERIGRAAGAAR